MLYSAIEQAPSAELVEPDIHTRYFATFDEQFFHYCDKELTKINTFYSGLYALGHSFRRQPILIGLVHSTYLCRKASRSDEKIR